MVSVRCAVFCVVVCIRAWKQRQLIASAVVCVWDSGWVCVGEDVRTAATAVLLGKCVTCFIVYSVQSAALSSGGDQHSLHNTVLTRARWQAVVFEPRGLTQAGRKMRCPRPTVEKPIKTNTQWHHTARQQNTAAAGWGKSRLVHWLQASPTACRGNNR